MAGCKPIPSDDGMANVTRLDDFLFHTPADSIAIAAQELEPGDHQLLNIVLEYVLQLGPDTSAGFSTRLREFVSDPVIAMIKEKIDSVAATRQVDYRSLSQGLSTFQDWIGEAEAPELITFVSGFNQSFLTVPGRLGIALDHYLGSDCVLYRDLGLPAYMLLRKNPGQLAPDALRAWIMSEMPPPSDQASLLEHMIFHGRIWWMLDRLLPDVSNDLIFSYSEEQMDWLHEHEKMMWEYLATEKILFSTDRMLIRRFTEDAPFTREFGNQSPDRAGNWIGYRIVSQYMKKNKVAPQNLVVEIDYRKILENARYKP